MKLSFHARLPVLLLAALCTTQGPARAGDAEDQPVLPSREAQIAQHEHGEQPDPAAHAGHDPHH